MKLKIDYFILPIVFIFLIVFTLFFEIFRFSFQPKLKIDFHNLTNQKKEEIGEAYNVIFQINLIKKEIKKLEKKYKNGSLENLKKRVEEFERKLINEKDIDQIKKISQDFWDSGIWEEIYNLEK